MRHDEPATMMHLIRPLLLLLGVLMVLLMSEAARGDSIRIYEVAGSDGPEVMLSQVAELDGDYAKGFGSVVVGKIDADQSQVVIDASSILTAMRDSGAKLGRLDLRGFGKCTVHQTYTGQHRAEVSSNEPAAANIDTNAGSEPITINTPTTVQALIERKVSEAMGIDQASLKITFDDRDADLLGASAVAGRFEVEPVVEPTLGAISFKVQGYNGTQRSGAAQSVSARVQLKVIAVVASERIARGELITRRQIRLREVLLDNTNQAYIDDTALVSGQVASQTLEAGDLITASQVKMPVAVNRRERVSVQLENRGVRITFNGVAQDQGAIGDMIEVMNPQTREIINATIVGRGRVVAGIDNKTSKEGA